MAIDVSSHYWLAPGQVSLLDPVSFPGAIKAFAREVCRNDLLNFGRLHFFFPDSRLALDLNTDKTLKVHMFLLLPAWIPAKSVRPRNSCLVHEAQISAKAAHEHADVTSRNYT